MASGMEITDTKYIRHRTGGDNYLAQLSDTDMVGATHYYGYVSSEGSWLIMEEIDTASIVTYRYKVGWSDYATAWASRAGVTYVRWNALGEQI